MVRFLAEATLFLSVVGFWGPPIFPVQWGPGGSSPGVKRPGCEADHAPSSSEVNEWSYTATPIRYCGMYRDSFTFLRDENYLLCKHTMFTFLGGFAELRKATTSVVMSACLTSSARLRACSSHWTDFDEI